MFNKTVFDNMSKEREDANEKIETDKLSLILNLEAATYEDSDLYNNAIVIDDDDDDDEISSENEITPNHEFYIEIADPVGLGT